MDYTEEELARTQIAWARINNSTVAELMANMKPIRRAPVQLSFSFMEQIEPKGLPVKIVSK